MMAESPNKEHIDSTVLPDKSHRRTVLQLLLVTTMSMGMFFCMLNWNSSFPLALAELGLASYAALLFPMARKPQMQIATALMFLVPLYSVFLMALALPGTAETVFVWILVIPVLSHLLLGRWFGLWVSVFFLVAAMAVFIGRFYDHEEIFRPASVANVVLATVSILLFSHVYEVSRTRAHRKLLHLATTDSLTTLANRTRFLDVFERERNHAARNDTSLSLLLLDLDHFKLVNDRYGHDIGDEVLKYIAAAITHRLRKTDLACRLGGEEFGILLPQATLEQAISVAEDIRTNIAEIPFARKEIVIPLTVSIGAAEYGQDGTDLESLYAIADSHLYKAKSCGRNQVQTRVSMFNGELDLV